MRIKTYLTFLVLICLSISLLQAQSYDKLWREVEKAQKKSLPQTQKQYLDKIYQKAQDEKNIPEMLRAYNSRVQLITPYTPFYGDSIQQSIEGLKQLLVTTVDAADKAVIHSLIASTYAEYTTFSSFSISKISELTTDESQLMSMAFWPPMSFYEVIKQHNTAALEEKELLLKTSVRRFVPFAVEGSTSAYYHHDLYHLLSTRAINDYKNMVGIIKSNVIDAAVDNIYNDLLSTYNTTSSQDAYILTQLSYLNWKYRLSAIKLYRNVTELPSNNYVNGLIYLLENYKHREVCVEVYNALAVYARDCGLQNIAYQYCEEGLAKFPSYKRINILRELRESIILSTYVVNLPSLAYPEDSLPVTIYYNNLPSISLSIYNQRNKSVADYSKKINSVGYGQQVDSFSITAPTLPGRYTIACKPSMASKNNIDDDERVLRVTTLKLLYMNVNNTCNVVVVNSKTGQPVEGATVVAYNANDKNPKERYTKSDGEGKAVVDLTSSPTCIYAKMGDNDRTEEVSIYNNGSNRYRESNKSERKVTLLTDRAIYRPGQTLHVKGIAYTQSGDHAEVVANEKYSLKLLDANRQEVAVKEMKTNEFGSFATEFTLPSACLNGTFALVTDNGRATIKVEDYKRPSFEISFIKSDESYRLGDSIAIKGGVQTYSGVPLEQSVVNYKIYRSPLLLWPLRGVSTEMIASGKTESTIKGEFSIPLSLAPDTLVNDIAYTFKVVAEVTNLAGETVTNEYALIVGSKSMRLTINLDKLVHKSDSLTAQIDAMNFKGVPIDTKGEYFLYALKEGQSYKAAMQTAVINKGMFTANETFSLSAWNALPSGRYLLSAKTKDSQGVEVTTEKELVLFSLTDTAPPVHETQWLYVVNDEFDANHPAIFYYGTSLHDVYVLVTTASQGKIIKSDTLHLDNQIRRYEVPYTSAYGKGVAINFTFVKEGELNQKNIQLKQRVPDTKLNMRWDVFRDKLRPGQEEEWRLTITNPDGKAANAEMLATMYDASLDVFAANNQKNSLYYPRFILPISWTTASYNGNIYLSWNAKFKSYKIVPLKYDYLQWSPISGTQMDLNEVVTVGYGTRSKKNKLVGAIRGVSSLRPNAGMVGVVEADAADLSEGEGQQDVMPSENVRTNLQETAFFYPFLRTNEQGEMVFSFTMPQALTRWNFRGYSHTKDMFTGMLTGSATTSKEFMLSPNMPRFVRIGDNATIAATITNKTSKNLSGNVSFTLFNPVNDKIVMTQKQRYTVDAGQTIAVAFSFVVPEGYELLACRMIAEGDNFSDGEQQLLPVLSNKVHLTESVSMPIRGNETVSYSLDKLFDNHSKLATNRLLTVEFTANPAWYAVQALPVLSNPTNDNAISWAAANYANAIASWIANSQPRIKAIFDAWKAQNGTKETLLSALQQNQQLKSILLNESPWVLEAKTEQQQMERIATLFDINNMRNNAITAETHLMQLQTPTGAWPWFKGMDGSRYITQYVAILNARLAMLTKQPLTGKLATLQENAVNYLHGVVAEAYSDRVKNKSLDVYLSQDELSYLYLIAIGNYEVPATSKAAYDYYLSKVEGVLTSGSMQQKAMAAIVLSKAGKAKVAAEFMASLKEHLTFSKEMGAYFTFNENPYMWSNRQLPAHVYVMEAFQMVSHDTSIVEEMKIWLLKQKQTQAWSNSVSTADALFALLMQGNNLLAYEGNVRIVIANQTINTANNGATPGLGYIKESFTQPNVLNAKNAVVTKTGEGIAWGAVYAQFTQPLDAVSQQGDGMSVTKQLYVERIIDNQRQLEPITATTSLAVGDRIVTRLNIKVMQAAQFVQLTDQRAACFEPIDSSSGYRATLGIGYYVDVKDASTNFFFDGLGVGQYQLDFTNYVSRVGTYQTGIATIQCAYAPELSAHSASLKLVVK